MYIYKKASVVVKVSKKTVTDSSRYSENLTAHFLLNLAVHTVPGTAVILKKKKKKFLVCLEIFC